MYDESEGRYRRTANPTQPSVYCGLLARIAGLGAAFTLSSAFFFFPVEVVDKRIVQGSSLEHESTYSMLAQARVSFR